MPMCLLNTCQFFSSDQRKVGFQVPEKRHYIRLSNIVFHSDRTKYYSINHYVFALPIMIIVLYGVLFRQKNEYVDHARSRDGFIAIKRFPFFHVYRAFTYSYMLLPEIFLFLRENLIADQLLIAPSRWLRSLIACSRQVSLIVHDTGISKKVKILAHKFRSYIKTFFHEKSPRFSMFRREPTRRNFLSRGSNALLF